MVQFTIILALTASFCGTSFALLISHSLLLWTAYVG